MAAPVDVRALDPADWRSYLDVSSHAFGESPSTAEDELERSVHEIDRSIAAYEGSVLVGTAAIYSFTMTVPGGPRPVAGVTWVSVLPSHRRRGVLTAMMRRQLDDLHDQGGEPVAALWASEAAIYGRFGYGSASMQAALEIPRSPLALSAEPADHALRVRLVAPEEALAVCEQVRETDRLARPGMAVRNERWQRRATWDPATEREGRSALRCVLVEDAAGVRGFARYATEPKRVVTGNGSVVHVREAHASDPAAYATLWRFLTDLDLTATVNTRNRPLDDPLLTLLPNPRISSPRLSSGLFTRLVDVGRALEGRSYATPVDVLLDVRDPFCPWNQGCWRLSADLSGAGCGRSTGTPDLSLSVTELGAAYLGGTSLLALAAAGRVTEHREGALAAASAAFRHDPLPWAPEVW